MRATKVKKVNTAIKELEYFNIAFEIKNNDTHFIVEESIDFWPTSKYELWIIRRSGFRGYGLKNLIAEITKEHEL